MDDSIIDQINLLAKQKEFEYLRGQEEIYVLYSRSLGTKYPAIDKNGFATVCTKREYAQKIVDKNSDVPLEIQTFRPAEFDAYVKDWYRLGVVKFRLNPGTDDHCQEMRRDDYLPDDKAKMWDYAGSSLNCYTIRYHQNKAMTDGGGQAAAMTLWSMICHVLPKSLLLAPFVYDEEDVGTPVEDSRVHVTAASAAAVRKLCMEKRAKSGDTDDNGSGASFLLYGADGYAFPNGDDANDGKTMHLRTVVNQGHNFVPAFTDFKSLEQMFGKNVRIGLFTYEELRERVADTVAGSGAAVEGIVLNPGDTNLVLPRSELDNIDAEKGGTPKIYLDFSYGKAKAEPASDDEEGEELPAPENPPVETPEPPVEKPEAQHAQEAQKAPAPNKKKYNGLCVASLITGILGILSLGTLIVPQILAVVLGVIGIRKASAHKQPGVSFGAAGYAMGLGASYFGMLYYQSVIGLVLFLLLAAASLAGFFLKRKK